MDRQKRQGQQITGYFASIKDKKKPLAVCAYSWGLRFVVLRKLSLLSCCHYNIPFFVLQYPLLLSLLSCINILLWSVKLCSAYPCSLLACWYEYPIISATSESFLYSTYRRNNILTNTVLSRELICPTILCFRTINLLIPSSISCSSFKHLVIFLSPASYESDTCTFGEL